MIMFNNINEDTLKKYSNLSIISGILFLLAGGIDIFQPVLGGISFIWILASLFIIVGLFKGYLVTKSHNNSAGAWFKVFGLFMTGVLLIIFPVIGSATIAMLLSFYFLFDGFSSVYMGFEFKPVKGWWVSIVNGLVSILLALTILIKWPISSLEIIGILIGISFIFDAIVMIYLGIIAKKL